MNPVAPRGDNFSTLYYSLKMLIGQKLAVTASKNSTKPAFRYLGRSTSYREAYDYISRYSYFLQKEIMHGKNVLVYMTNCPHMAFSFFALANTKNTAIFGDPSWTSEKLSKVISDFSVHAIIASDDCVVNLKRELKSKRINIPIIQCEKRRWSEYENTYRLPPSMSAGDSDVVAYFDTQGVSGRPKCVPYTHAMLNHAAMALTASYRLSANDIMFSYGSSLTKPFYFMHGLMLPLLTGAGVYISDEITPSELQRDLIEARVTRVLMKSLMVEEWLDILRRENLKIPTIRSITVEHGPLGSKAEVLSQDYFNLRLLRFYGSVETCFAVAMQSFDNPESPESVGQFLKGLKTRVTDQNGDDLPTNKVRRGQLLVSGPSVATSYFKNKDATKTNMRGTWFFTGDMVEVNKEQVVTYLDRRDNLNLSTKEFVLPSELEAHLSKCQGVHRAAVAHIKNKMGKLELTAFIVKSPGSKLTIASLQELIDQSLPIHERPKKIIFLSELPLDDHGLVNKYKLRQEFN